MIWTVIIILTNTAGSLIGLATLQTMHRNASLPKRLSVCFLLCAQAINAGWHFLEIGWHMPGSTTEALLSIAITVRLAMNIFEPARPSSHVHGVPLKATN